MLSIFQRLFGGGDQEPDDSSESPMDQRAEFSVGDRVRDAQGIEGTVIDVDPNAEHGLGIIKVKYADGREISLALIASGLEKTNNE